MFSVLPCQALAMKKVEMKFVAIDTKRNCLGSCHQPIVCVWECHILIEIQAILEVSLVNVGTMPIMANGWDLFGCGRDTRCGYFLLELHDLFACVSMQHVENTSFGDALETVDLFFVFARCDGWRWQARTMDTVWRAASQGAAFVKTWCSQYTQRHRWP